MRSFDILLDIGNTRSKWVAVSSEFEQGFKVLHEGQCLNRELIENHSVNLEQVFVQAPNTKIEAVFCSCVGGDEIRDLWQKCFSKAQFKQLRGDYLIPGFKNTYQNPAELGSDRFAGVLGAYDLYPIGSSIVVSCGTATTIDFVDKGSVFQGGWILPGIDLMLQSLGKSTAQLPHLTASNLQSSTLSSTNLNSLSSIENSTLPNISLGKNTEQAISMGVLLSIVGAIEYAVQQLSLIHI